MRDTASLRARAIALAALVLIVWLSASARAQGPAPGRDPRTALDQTPQRLLDRIPQASPGQAPQRSPGQVPRPPGVQLPQTSQEPEPQPDLRIVRVGVSPSPLREGQGAVLTVMVHNDSPVVAVGSMAVDVTHDRRTSLPLPPRREVLYLGPDGLVELSFELPVAAMAGSPYTFFATVDADNQIAEANEANNTIWERVPVCGGPETVEIADGYDNDCDGMIDEGLGLSADPVHALGRLRALQRQAEHDRVQLIFATPRLLAPQPVEHMAWLASEEGDLVGLPPRAGAELSADFAPDAAGARLALVDWNGGELESGDLISLRARGEAVVAAGGGGGSLLSRAVFREQERLLSIVRLEVGDDDGVAVAAAPTTPIESGDVVAIAAWTGHFLSAEQGGGGRLRIDREVVGGWESFTITLEGSDGSP